MENNLTTQRDLHAADLMPKDPQIQAVLRQRAQYFANAQKNADTSISDINKYVCFCLGAAQEQYGIPYQYVVEVMNNAQVTKLPNVPSHISGVINRHGALIAIVDLKQLFQTQISDYTENSRIIVISAQNMTLGILTDSILGSDIYDPSKLDPPLIVRDTIKSEFIIGLHKGVTAIINIESLLSSPELRIRK